MRTIVINPAEERNCLVLVLGVAPLLAGASTLAGGIAMGGFFLTSLIVNCIIINVIRSLVQIEIRLIIIVVVAALTVSILRLLMQTWFYDASLLLDIYLPLVAMNCILLVVMNDYAMNDKLIAVLIPASVTGIGMLLLSMIIGAARQYINLPVLQGPPGVFLMLALAIVLLKIIGNTRIKTDSFAT